MQSRAVGQRDFALSHVTMGHLLVVANWRITAVPSSHGNTRLLCWTVKRSSCSNMLKSSTIGFESSCYHCEERDDTNTELSKFLLPIANYEKWVLIDLFIKEMLMHSNPYILRCIHKSWITILPHAKINILCSYCNLVHTQSALPRSVEMPAIYVYIC